jgi:hypothetical protein
MNKMGRRMPPTMPPATRAVWDMENAEDPPLPPEVAGIEGVVVTVTVAGGPGALVDVRSELAKEGCERLGREAYLGFTLLQMRCLN